MEQQHEDIEADQCRHRTQEPVAALNIKENVSANVNGQQQKQIGDDPSVQPQHAVIPIDQAQEQEQSGTFCVNAPDLKG